MKAILKDNLADICLMLIKYLRKWVIIQALLECGISFKAL